MKLVIERTKTLGEIKKEFNDVYPYLKLEFFSKPHEAYKTSPAKFILHDETVELASIVPDNFHDGSLNIDQTITVKHLESFAEEKFGIHLQVLRRSGHAWLATTVSDNLTLHEQNQRGYESTIKPEPDEKMDYREQD